MSEQSCRNCRWRKERHRTHAEVHDRIIHLCTHPSQRIILGVDWKRKNSWTEPYIEANLGFCGLYWEPMVGGKIDGGVTK